MPKTVGADEIVDHTYKCQGGACECPIVKADWDHARDDKFDRGIDAEAIEWAVFSPGMQTEFRLATLPQILAPNSPFSFDAKNAVDVARLQTTRPGDWIRYKEGIAIRLGRAIDPFDE